VDVFLFMNAVNNRIILSVWTTLKMIGRVPVAFVCRSFYVLQGDTLFVCSINSLTSFRINGSA
jgi:hypothetical protein